MQNRQALIFVVSLLVFVLASTFVCTYMISQALFKKIRLSEYLMLAAWISDLGLSISFLLAVTKGLGIRTTDISPENGPAVNITVYIFNVLYNLTSMIAKCSVLVFFRGLTQGKNTFYWANMVTLFVVVVAGVALTIHQAVLCKPMSAITQYQIQTKDTCEGIFTGALSSSPFNIFTDIAILAIPIPLLTRTPLPLLQKVVLVFAYAVGILVIVVDVTRIAFFQSKVTTRLRVTNLDRVEDVGNEDYTWFAALPLMWSTVEVNMTIICACVPGLRPLAARISPIRLQNQKSNGNKRKSQYQRKEGLRSRLKNTYRNYMNTTDQDHAYPRQMQFVHLLNTKPTSMVRLRAKNSIAPNALITIVFFLWGFSYGLFSILNTKFGVVAQLDHWGQLGLHAAYFGGYLLGPLLVGRIVLKKLGFAALFIAGFYLYACGTLIFWPAAVLVSLPTYLVSSVIVGIGLGILEAASNSFISLCGPLEYSEIRLCVAQGFQGVGSVGTRLLAAKALFSNIEHPLMVHVQWTYLGVTFYNVLLAIVFYYLPLPEAPDDDLRELAKQRPENNTRVLGFPVFYLTLGLGVWSQFFYVAAQEVHLIAFINITKDYHIRSWTLPPDLPGIFGLSLFTIGRFLSALVQWTCLKPRFTLLVAYLGMIVFSILCMKTSGLTYLAMAFLVFLFEGGTFPIIYSISLRGTGQHVKTATTFMATTIGAGAIFPFAQYGASLAHGDAYSYCVQFALYSAGAIFPLYLNLVPAARRQVDPVKGEYIRPR